MLDGFDLKMESFGISDGIDLLFYNIPDDYKMSNFKLEAHDTYMLGRLKSLNRIRVISHWKKSLDGNLVKFFKEQLIKRNWDFNLCDNPYAVIIKYKNK